MKTFKEYVDNFVTEALDKEFTRLIIKEEPSDEDYDYLLDELEAKDLNNNWESGDTDDYEYYEFISRDPKEIKELKKILKHLKIKVLKEIKDEPAKDLKKMNPDEACLALFQSQITSKGAKPGVDEYLAFKFGSANGSIWIESDYTAGEIADFNKKETYLGLTYKEVVDICKKSNAVQAKRRK